MASRKILGRGVGALLPDEDLDPEDSRFFLCDIEKIRPNADQPRSYFDEDKLVELAESIREKGVLQPLLVSKAKGNRYDLIAGERRLRAARIAGKAEVPVVVMTENGEGERLELALIENIQRHDLNPIEEAMAYERLIEEFGLTQEDVAQRVGKQRSTITNTLRLLGLPQDIRDDVLSAKLSEGHARVLLRLKELPDVMLQVRDRIISENLSVRATENLCRQLARPQNSQGATHGRPPRTSELPADYCHTLLNQLTNCLNTKVRIIQSGKRGKLEIEYYSSDDLDRLCALLTNTIQRPAR
ncbi:MAG: chromosome partitioning protein ParB [Desulfobulbus propionicus]|nr:MAG: chromosome partitioning protein ParB [Desulfobulbus propionicus]